MDGGEVDGSLEDAGEVRSTEGSFVEEVEVGALPAQRRRYLAVNLKMVWSHKTNRPSSCLPLTNPGRTMVLRK